MTLDTGPAKRPGLPVLRTSDPALSRWSQVVAEHLEMHMGARGNPKERAATIRELEKVAGGIITLQTPKTPQQGQALLDLGGGLTASVAIDQFIESIKNTRLFKDLIQRLDDPSRFDYLPEAVRETLLRSISEEAIKRGAEITRLETKMQNSIDSLALVVEEVTAAVGGASSGVRELTFASAQQSRAQAGKITQLEASLGNYYADGTPGRVILEQVLEVVADRVDGLRGQYTLKVQAGGALAGFGIAAEEINGVPSSAFIITADKFAIVAPNYTGGLTNTPNVNNVPFGVDASGIFLNNNVYIRGNIRVDTAGRRLIDGLRGSVNIAASGTAWSDNVARQAVWTALGNAGLASNNNHLVIGDSVTISGSGFVQTRAWFGSSWIIPGVIINGNLLVDGSIAAQKIDTRNLTIRDAAGNIIFGAGQNLDVSRVAGLGALATASSVSTAQVDGLGPLATASSVTVGSNVRLPDGTVLQTADFVNRLSRISAGNISTFISDAAIGNAYIGNAAISTLKIAGETVTVPRFSTAMTSQALNTTFGPDVAPVTFVVDGIGPTETVRILATGTISAYPTDNVATNLVVGIFLNGIQNTEVRATLRADGISVSIVASGLVPAGTYTVTLRFRCDPNPNGAATKATTMFTSNLIVTTAKR